MRNYPMVLLRLIACLIVILLFRLNSCAQSKPNIILIYADDLGYGEIEAYGQKIIKTPHLSRLASEGMKFTNMYSGTALCAPARCQLLTGMHSGHSDVRANKEMAQGPASFTDELERGQTPLPDAAQTIAEMLKPHGYATACIGKWGLGMADTEGSPNQQGFDYFYGYLDQKQAHNYYPTHLWENGQRVALNNKSMTVHTKITPGQATDETFNGFIGKDYSIDLMAGKVKEFILEQKGKPFFLYYTLPLPHLALQIPPEAMEHYMGKFEETAYLGEKGYAPTKYPRATYASKNTYLDKKVGEIMSQLDEAHLRENTLIIFTSDNGPVFPIGGCDPEFFDSNGPLRDYKGSLYEGGIRMPFIASWPGRIKSGTISHHIAAQYDIKATIADLLNQPLKVSDGISILPTLLGEKQAKHDYLYFELMEYGGQQAVRAGDWKAVKRNQLKDKNAPWELYNLKEDIGEQANLSSRNPKILNRLKRMALEAHRDHAHVAEWNFME